MLDSKINIRKTLLLCGACTLALPVLAGCQAEHGPFSMPTGYEYHTKHVRSAAGPKPMITKPIHKSVPQLPQQEDSYYAQRTAVNSGFNQPRLLNQDEITGDVQYDPLGLLDKTTRMPAPAMLTTPSDQEIAMMAAPITPVQPVDPALEMVPPGEDKIEGNLYLSINYLIRNLSYATDEPIISVFLKPSRAADNKEELEKLEFSIRNGFMANGIQILPEEKSDELVAEYWIEKANNDKDELYVNLMFGKRTLAEESVILGESAPLEEPQKPEPEERPVRKTRPSGGPLLLTPQG